MTRFIFFSVFIHIALAAGFIFFSDKSILDRLNSFSFSENPIEDIQEDSKESNQENQANQKSSLKPVHPKKPVNSVKKISKNIKKTKTNVKRNMKPSAVVQKDSKKTIQKDKNISEPNPKPEKLVLSDSSKSEKPPVLAKPLEPKQPVLAHQKEETAPIKNSEEKIAPQSALDDEKQEDLSLNDFEEDSLAHLTSTQKVFDELEQEEEISEFNAVLNKMDGDQSLSPQDLAQLENPTDKAYETPPDNEDIPLIPKEKQRVQAKQNFPDSSVLAPESKDIKSYKTLKQSPGNPKPIYPNQARQNNQQGSVLLLYFVDESGLVDKIQMLKSSGHSLLDNEALRVLSRQQYLPGQSGWYKHRVDFRLKQTEEPSFSLSSG